MQSITEGGAAEKAGLVGGDTLLQFDGHAVDDFETLRDLIASKRPRDEVRCSEYDEANGKWT